MGLCTEIVVENVAWLDAEAVEKLVHAVHHHRRTAHEVLDVKGKKIRKDMSDGDEDYEENFYIIYKSSMPAVLTENFFMTTKTDVAYLESEEGKKDIVDIHIKGIQKYIELKFNTKK